MLGFDLQSAASLQRFETQFQDLGKIGAGGFSIVSKVRNLRDKKIYALKTVKIKPSEFKGHIADYLEKIISQAKIASQLNHSNILKYHGCWISADTKTQQDLQNQHEQSNQEQQELQLVMEQYDQKSCGFEFEHQSQQSQRKQKSKNKKNMVPIYHQNANDNIFGTNLYNFKQIRVYMLSQLGECSLQKYINLRNTKFRKTELQQRKITIENYHIILDIIQGLSYIHNQKIIHRDIKLQNIIIDEHKRCKIIDFGLAKKVRNLKSLTIQKFQHEIINSDDSQRHSSSVGTKIFSSPQQSNSQNYDYRTDIYSLALVIGIIFSQYQTAHEQGELLLNLRNKKLDNFTIDQRLKNLMLKCLSEQKMRPELKQLKICVKKLLRQNLQKLKLQENVSKKQKTPNENKQQLEIKIES